MSKFSSKSKSNNDEIIKMQKQQAKEAERKEKERQYRLEAGRQRIQAMFTPEGGTYETPRTYGQITEQYQAPVYKTRMVRNPNYRYIDPDESYGMRNISARRNNPRYIEERYKTPKTETRTRTTMGWRPGEEKTVEGLGEGFYDNFRKSIYDYYTPEVARQHEDAKKANLFDLARRGLLRSSTAAENAEELVRERAEADARVAADAENQTAGLRSDISRAQQSALQLLEQSADPESAANAARTEVNAIQSRSPNFSPLGELFSAAARSYAGWQNAQNARRNYGSIPTRNPYTSEGRNVA